MTSATHEFHGERFTWLHPARSCRRYFSARCHFSQAASRILQPHGSTLLFVSSHRLLNHCARSASLPRHLRRRQSRHAASRRHALMLLQGRVPTKCARPVVRKHPSFVSLRTTTAAVDQFPSLTTPLTLLAHFLRNLYVLSPLPLSLLVPMALLLLLATCPWKKVPLP